MSSDQVRRDFVRALNQIEKLDSKIHKIQSRISSLERDKYLKEGELKPLNERIKVSQQEFSNKTRRSDWLRLSRQRVSVKNKILHISRKVISEDEEKGNFGGGRGLLRGVFFLTNPGGLFQPQVFYYPSIPPQG